MKRKALMVALMLALLFLAAEAILVDLSIADPMVYYESLPVNQAYIRNNGDVDPPTLPIQRSGNTYVLKDNILNYTIEIEKDNVVIDGNGYSLSIPSYGETDKYGSLKTAPPLIQISGKNSIIIKNLKFQNCTTAIGVTNSSKISIIQNTMTNCAGIYFGGGCSYCSILKNDMFNNTDYAIQMSRDAYPIDIKYNKISGSIRDAVSYVSNSNIIGNIFVGNHRTALSQIGSFNRIIGNIFQQNRQGISTDQENNEIHHNNFINNRYGGIAINAPNILDDGKEGNYWSSNRNSKPLVISSVFINDNESNVDNFPRISPYIFDYQPPVVEVVSPQNKTYFNGSAMLVFATSEEISRATYSFDGDERVTLQNDTILNGLSEGTHHLIVYAEDAFGNEGTSEIFFEIATLNILSAILVISISMVFVAAGLLFYFKKHRH